MEPTFEWDENKKQANVRKHGIDFDDAKRVFSDPAAITFASTAEHGELGVVGHRSAGSMSAEEEYIVRFLVDLPDGSYIVEHPDGRLERRVSQTDWARVDALTDEEIEAAMRDDPDWADLMDVDWSDAVVVVPRSKPVWLQLDTEVVDFFKSQGPGYQTLINAVLRRFMEKAKKAEAAE